MMAAISRLVTTQAPALPLTTQSAHLQPPLSPTLHLALPLSPAHTSTPRSVRSVRCNLIPTDDQFCDFDDNEPFLSNSVLLHDRAKHHVNKVVKLAASRLPRASGKQIFDIYSKKQAAYEMPLHYVGAHSQRRVQALKYQDELLLSEYLQGFSYMILQHEIKNKTVKAMILHLDKLGEGLTDYGWSEMRDWCNTVLHDVGQGRYTWSDKNHIMEIFNATKMCAARTSSEDSSFPVCALYNQGKCTSQVSHDQFSHSCVLCWVTTGALYLHTLATGRRRGNTYLPANNYRSQYWNPQQTQGSFQSPQTYNRAQVIR